MKSFVAALLVCMGVQLCSAQYNTLWIPDTLSGTTFNLALQDTFVQFMPGNQTITGGVNGAFWGPTLIFNKWDTVHMNVQNNLNDSSTVHWHGFHLPAVMDGGPHQIIPPGTLWQPYWQVKNAASTYWYHPHLHEMSQGQINKGLGGLIIVRDSTESALVLPRTYGIDDIPLVISDREFDGSNQIVDRPYGDTVMVNGVLHPQTTVPAQMVRFRILNPGPERSLNLGFSDNRSFSIIGSDGGLLAAPVSLTRYLLHAGERIEIVVNFTGQNGQMVTLKAFNSTLNQQIAGGDNIPFEPFANDLAQRDFNILRLNIGTATANPITTLPTTLTTINPLNAANANITRTLSIRDSMNGPGGATFVVGATLFDFDVNNYTVPLGNTEIWQLQSTSNFGHPFHIHDVEFNILTVNGAAPSAAQAGWKDVVFVPAGQTVRFIARFEDYADALHPFMYHCHIAVHEDEGMMGQFVVTGTTALPEAGVPIVDFASLYPNPTTDRLNFRFTDAAFQPYYVRILNSQGKTVMMLPSPDLRTGVDVAHLPAGVYTAQVTDRGTFRQFARTFVVQ
jgi:blue copper oxidase